MTGPKLVFSFWLAQTLIPAFDIAFSKAAWGQKEDLYIRGKVMGSENGVGVDWRDNVFFLYIACSSYILKCKQTRLGQNIPCFKLWGRSCDMHVELELGSGWTEKAAHISNAPSVVLSQTFRWTSGRVTREFRNSWIPDLRRSALWKY
jgi:hypothetical protein